jgi:hypothetical protein
MAQVFGEFDMIKKSKLNSFFKICLLGFIFFASLSSLAIMEVPSIPHNIDLELNNVIVLTPLQAAVQNCESEVDNIIISYREDMKLLRDPRLSIQPEELYKESKKELDREYNNLAYYDVASKCWNQLSPKLRSGIKISEFRAAVQRDFNLNK